MLMNANYLGADKLIGFTPAFGVSLAQPSPEKAADAGVKLVGLPTL